MEKDTIREYYRYISKWCMLMNFGEMRVCTLQRLACISVCYQESERMLKKYRIKCELKKPFLQKIYELFGKAV